MLTAIHIGNFKAFGPTQRIPVKPLTLIFGPNSSGKSSIIQGLLLFRHVAAGHTVNARRVWQEEEAVDLGGFKEYVRDHNEVNVVDLALQLDSGQPMTLSEWQELEDADSPILVHLSVGTRVPRKKDAATEERPQLLRVRVSPDDTHPGADPVMGAPNLRRGTRSDSQKSLDHTLRATLDVCGGLTQVNRTTWEFLAGNREILDIAYGLEQNNHFRAALEDSFIPSLFYLGPLRSYPPRSFLFTNESDPNYFSSGVWAWDHIRSNSDLRQAVNAALRRFGLRYQLDVLEWVSQERPSESLKEVLLLNDKGLRLSHRDLGMGVCQVLPVIIQSMTAFQSLVAIEQPELHLHPALQAELGDLFIESALGARRNRLLVETHSEHLILRILRRVRETTEGKLPAGAIPVRPEDVSVVFVEPAAQGAVVRHLPVTPDGDFGAPWPGGFFAERFQDLP